MFFPHGIDMAGGFEDKRILRLSSTKPLAHVGRRSVRSADHELAEHNRGSAGISGHA